MGKASEYLRRMKDGIVEAARKDPADAREVCKACSEIIQALAGPDDDFEGIIADAVKMSDEEIRKHFNGLDARLEQVSDALNKITESADLLSNHHAQFKTLESKLTRLFSTKQPGSIFAWLAQLQAAVEGEGRKIVEAIDGATERRGEEVAHLARQPVDVDARVVADRLLQLLRDSEEARGLIGVLVESYFNERRRDFQMVVDDLPRLFDAVEGRYREWEDGTRLTDSERQARRDVLDVLGSIREELVAWKRRHQIEEIPGPDEEPGEFDRAAHEWKKTVPTPDADRHNRIDRVIKPGYRWPYGRLRKAQVAVFGPCDDVSEADGAVASSVERSAPSS